MPTWGERARLACMVGREHPPARTTPLFFGGLAPFDGISTIKTAKKLLGSLRLS
jgi:hypothetical protein